MYVSIPDCFMIAFLAGLIFGPVYELLRIIRLILRMRIAVFLCDIAFFIGAGFVVCKLSEFLGSYIRMYTVIGFGAGVFTYIVTLGRLFNSLEASAADVWRRTIGKLFRKLNRSTKNILIKIAQKSRGGIVKTHKYLSNFMKIHLKRLHLSGEKMYNIKGNDMLGEGENTHVINVQIRKNN